jgi:hypothetical protein
VPSASTRVREVDSVLVRMPSRVRQRVAEIAHSADISQNTFYAAAALEWVLVRGEIPRVGSPQNLMLLFEEITLAVQTGEPVVGAFQANDWAEVEQTLSLLDDFGIISDLKSKKDAKTSLTFVYGFQVTKLGRSLWRDLMGTLKMAIGRAISDIASRCEDDISSIEPVAG